MDGCDIGGCDQIFNRKATERPRYGPDGGSRWQADVCGRRRVDRSNAQTGPGPGSAVFRKGEVVYANRHCLEVMGYTGDEF